MRFLITMKATTDPTAGVMAGRNLITGTGKHHETLAWGGRFPDPAPFGRAREIEVRPLWRKTRA